MVADSDSVTQGAPPVSFLERYRNAPRSVPASAPDAAPGEAVAPVAGGAAEYEACALAARGTHPRLRLCYADGTTGLMAYAYLVEVLCTSPQYLSLIYSNVAITLEGRHLDQLLDALQDERAKALACFNARRHGPPEVGRPVITKMVRQRLQDVAAQPRKGQEEG